MKRTTKIRKGKARETLSLGAIMLIRRTHGMAAKIAALAHVDRSYVSQALARKRPPSAKLRAAIEQVLMAAVSEMEIEAVRLTLPGSSSCGPREMGAR